MTSFAIPASWLRPRRQNDRWQFRCNATLDDLVSTQRAARYFRQVVTLFEEETGILDYHLKLRPNFSRGNHLDVSILFGNPYHHSNPAPIAVCISCESTHALGNHALLSEQPHTRAWLDARGRKKLIITPVRHVERLAELVDETGEMDAFWRDAVDLLRRECDQLDRFYPTFALNHGKYRNHAHLHLKMSFDPQGWDATIGLRHRDRIEQLLQLSKEPSIREDCFGFKQHTRRYN